MLKEMLCDLQVPALLPRDEMLTILQREAYGIMPQKPESLSFSVEENVISHFCAGKASCNRVTAHCTVKGKEFSFPFYVVLPTDGKKHPFFVHINFFDTIPSRYTPVEELVDNGFAVLEFCYKDVTSDDSDFTNGLAGVLYEDGKRQPEDAGKIAIWAWAAQRVMDYAQTRGDILLLESAVVCGHSRLGKTALLAAATDTRFAFAYSNDSGCSGAAISRGKQGETVEKICKAFPYWFCENYREYAGREQEMPFDQHYLIASIAPRCVLVGSASEDLWADPVAEQLGCLAASPAFSKGLECPDRPAQIGEMFFDGNVGYHLRGGEHYFSREDWQKVIKFVHQHTM